MFMKTKVKDYLFGEMKMLCNPETSAETDPLKKVLWKALCLAYAYMKPERTVIIDDGQPGLNTFSFFKYVSVQVQSRGLAVFLNRLLFPEKSTRRSIQGALGHRRTGENRRDLVVEEKE